MMNNFEQAKHDFINNSLRLEVLFRLIGKQLESGQIYSSESSLDSLDCLEDLEKSLLEMQKLIQKLKA